MSDNLAKRLRYAADHVVFAPHMHHVAADRIEHLEMLIESVLTYLDNEADVIDGDDGMPAPNKAMSMATWIRVEMGANK